MNALRARLSARSAAWSALLDPLLAAGLVRGEATVLCSTHILEDVQRVRDHVNLPPDRGASARLGGI